MQLMLSWGGMFMYNNGDYEIQTFCYNKTFKYTDTGLLETTVNTNYNEIDFNWMIGKLSYAPKWYGYNQNQSEL